MKLGKHFLISRFHVTDISKKMFYTAYFSLTPITTNLLAICILVLRVMHFRDYIPFQWFRISRTKCCRKTWQSKSNGFCLNTVRLRRVVLVIPLYMSTNGKKYLTRPRQNGEKLISNIVLASFFFFFLCLRLSFILQYCFRKHSRNWQKFLRFLSPDTSGAKGVLSLTFPL